MTRLAETTRPAEQTRPARTEAPGTRAKTALFANAETVAARAPGAPPLVALAVDAEEDFDWTRPLPGTAHDTGCMRHLGDLQAIAGAYGLRPTYLLTYPVLQDVEAVRMLRQHHERDACALGVQLHGWVTPPLGTAADLAASFAGNLPRAEEAAKLASLVAAFVARFGMRPKVFRAGRYGVGPATAALLEAEGFAVDVSLAPRTRFVAEGGPDFSDIDCTPFWFGQNRRLLEVPLCRSIVGWGGAPARRLYRALDQANDNRAAQAGTRQVTPARLAAALLTRLRAAERLTLSPEGQDLAAIRRLARHLLARGEPVLTISFHSSSLRVGQNPYVRDRADLHAFYDVLSASLDFLAGAKARFVTLEALPALLAPAA